MWHKAGDKGPEKFRLGDKISVFIPRVANLQAVITGLEWDFGVLVREPVVTLNYIGLGTGAVEGFDPFTLDSDVFTLDDDILGLF